MTTVKRSKTPALLQTLQWVFHPLEYMETNFQRFGDLFQAEISPVNPEPLILVNHPEAIQYLLTRDNSNEITAPGEVNILAKPLLGENSLILLNGKQHRQRRQLVMPPFHGDRMKAYGELICSITRELKKAEGRRQKCSQQLLLGCSIRALRHELSWNRKAQER